MKTHHKNTYTKYTQCTHTPTHTHLHAHTRIRMHAGTQTQTHTPTQALSCINNHSTEYRRHNRILTVKHDIVLLIVVAAAQLQCLDDLWP